MVKSNSIYQILEADMAKENRNRFAEGRVNHAHITIFPRLRFFFAFYKMETMILKSDTSHMTRFIEI